MANSLATTFRLLFLGVLLVASPVAIDVSNAISQELDHQENSSDSVIEESSQAYIDDVFKSVRNLIAVQDQISRGDKSAPKRHKKLLEEANKLFKTLPYDIWKEPRNGMAAAVFMIVGGSSATFRSLLGKGVNFGPHEDFVKGAIAYRERNIVEAKKRLNLVKASSLSRVPAACLNLVNAILISQDDPKLSAEKLEFVGVGVPGGYLEDTAMRLRSSLALTNKQHKEFLDVTAQYLRRFYNSLYAKPFLRNAAKAILKMNPDDKSGASDAQTKVFEHVPVKRRISFFLTVAKEALRQGKLNSARAFAQAAQQLDTNVSRFVISSELYMAAASVFANPNEAEDVARKYQSRRRRLSRGVGDLADAIVAVIQSVHAPVKYDFEHEFDETKESMAARRLIDNSKTILSISKVIQK